MTIEKIWKDKKEDRKIIILFKSMKHEYLEDTMKEGKFCFCHPTVFNKWEDRESAQYDKWEGHSSVEAIDLYVAPIMSEKEDGTIVYGKMQKLANRGIVHIQTGEAKHTPICCFRMIEQEDVEIIDGKHFSFSINGAEERIMKEFGHDTFVLMQIAPFLERIRKAVPSCYTGAVVYQDNLINRLENDNQLRNISFDKNGNLETNASFDLYREKADDFYRFELSRFL